MNSSWEGGFSAVCILKLEPFQCVFNVHLLIDPDGTRILVSGNSNSQIGWGRSKIFHSYNLPSWCLTSSILERSSPKINKSLTYKMRIISIFESPLLRWWASSSDMLIYPYIFAFPSLSLHHRSTTTHLHSDVTTRDRARSRTTIALALSDRSRLFDGHMTYDSHVFTSILSISNVPPPAVWPITRSCTVRSGTYYSFAICSHSCLPFVFNLPVFTFHQRTLLPKPRPIAYMSLPQNWDFTLMLCTISRLFRTISHYFASHRTATIPPSLLATIHLETIPYPQIAPPQSPIGFILRSPAT